MIKFEFETHTENFQWSKNFPELLPNNKVVVETNSDELNIHQMFQLFKQFLKGMDFNEYQIISGACSLAFNDSNDQSEMQKVMNEFDLEEKKYDFDKDFEILDLKAKISRLKNPNLPQYTDEEIDVMCYKNRQKNFDIN